MTIETLLSKILNSLPVIVSTIFTACIIPLITSKIKNLNIDKNVHKLQEMAQDAMIPLDVIKGAEKRLGAIEDEYRLLLDTYEKHISDLHKSIEMLEENNKTTQEKYEKILNELVELKALIRRGE